MKKVSFLLLAAFCLCVNFASAQPSATVARLNKLYDELSARSKAVTDSCRYTGSSFEGGHRGFAMQRGDGKGWTTGRRITLKNFKPGKVARIRKIIAASKAIGFANLRHPDWAYVFDENSRTFYGYRYDEAAQTLFFLKASTPGEICVPSDWTTRTYLDATEKHVKPKPFIPATDSGRRLLGLSRLWAGVRQNFVFMDKVKINWDSLYVDMMPRITGAKDDGECVRLMQKMVAAVQDGHTYVWGASSYPVASAPFTTKLLEGRVYVDQVFSSDMKKKGLKRGMELLKVGGRDVMDYGREEVAPYVASSTKQWLEHMTYDDFNLLRLPEGQTVELELRDGPKTVALQYKNGEPAQDLWENHDVISFDLLPGNVGLLTVRNFMDSQMRSLFDKLYPRLLKTDALIIDLRGNGGGNSGNADYILRHLSKDSIRTDSWKSPMYVPALASWGYAPRWYRGGNDYMAPVANKPIYERPVAVMIDAGTFSAAEDFCGVFKGMKRGPLVGSPTGGSTGNGVRIELIPGVAWANICSKHDTAPDGTEFVGKGFIPDIPAAETYKTYFEDKTGACLTKALEYVKAKK